jgi:hypothetical protein
MVAKTLIPIADGLWGIDDVGGLPGGAKLPVRATVMALANGELAIHSPVAMDESVVTAVRRLGPVLHLIAPSALHHMHLPAALKHFPEAKVYGTRALLKKRKDLNLHAILNDGIPAEMAGDLSSITLAGAPNVDETVFFHKASRSLLVTDMVFHITRPQGIMSKLMLSCTGTNGRLAQSRLWHLFAKDKKSFVQSTHEMLGWNFDRLVPCHGDVLATGAKAAVQSALRLK